MELLDSSRDANLSDFSVFQLSGGVGYVLGPHPVYRREPQLTNRRRRTFITRPNAKNTNNVADPP